MQSIHRYEDSLTYYIQQQDLAAFRKQHFQQWSLAENGCSYCIAPEGRWRFFGFVPRHNLAALLTAFHATVEDIHRLPETVRKRLNPNNLPEKEILLVAVTQKKEFLYCRLDTTALQNKVEGQKRLWDIPHPQSWQASLLDFCQAHPLFPAQLPWKVIPGSLEMWDQNRAIILIAQLARPLGRLSEAPQMGLAGALFDFLEKPLIKFLVKEFPVATLGQYQFLWEAENPTDQQERMQALKHRPGLVPRFLLADL